MKTIDSLDGEVVLITGSTDGLGKLVARHLAERRATVLLHGRDTEKGRAVLNELSRISGNGTMRYYNADYSSLQRVRLLTDELLKQERHIDILINNVGIGRGNPASVREVSVDSLELRFAVNYLAHVLLTERILPLLTPKRSRIINVASVGQSPLDFSDLMLEKSYDGFDAYKRSKTALVMYTFDLASRLKDKGVQVNAVHPASLMNTKMVVEDWGYTLSTVEQGAEAVEHLLSTETTGEYYDGKTAGKAIVQAYDQEARAKLRSSTWKLLEKWL